MSVKMTIADLRIRLQDISSAIAQQKEILRALEQDKSDVQRELNGNFDPMAQLPLEISSDIFMHCLPETPGLDPATAPIFFLNICHAWSNIALATPALWSAIYMKSPRTETFEQRFMTWIQRASGLPISLALRGSLDQHVQASVKQHTHRLHHLELYINSDDDLKHIAAAAFPHLKTLKIEGPFYRRGQRNPDTYISILCAAPSLVECEFIKMYYLPAFHGTQPKRLTHASLQHLRLAKPHWKHHSETVESAQILRYLTLPALQTLILPLFDRVPARAFLSFLEHSSPPLQSLCMNPDGPGTFATISPNPLHFLDVVLAPDPGFLPNLRSLTILSKSGPHFPYGDLISLLVARRASHHAQPLQAFHLDFKDGIIRAPHADVLSALRQLVDDGMIIRVGPEERNLI
ncbi:hypothetical protein B0H17DRAFT_1193450 [Mycena rosella]|uniref:F-box domain-containing protein n=1 Tax=Mycena rosella TaxID=1033263 RepID=A0AAD7GTU4_MYCRO|nr:hypothetical protein B0H17DRAFT_1193450 [Mycena rosella]